MEQMAPFLASAGCVMRTVDVDAHPAMKHRIINVPNPGMCELERVPETSDNCVLVKLGPPISPMETGSKTWWPKAYSSRVRSKLLRRITYEGNIFFQHAAIIFGLFDELYTAKKFRLKYRSSPVSDMGLCRGKFRVTSQDQLAYVLPDGTVKRGQDPDNHWWMYFTTARGEELILDFGVYTWNLANLVRTEPYVREPIIAAPMTFINRELGKAPGIHLLYTEQKRVSFMRDPQLEELITKSTRLPMEDIMKWLGDALGRPFTKKERAFFPEWCHFLAHRIVEMDEKGSYKRWPKEADKIIDLDPLEEFAEKGVMPPRGGE